MESAMPKQDGWSRDQLIIALKLYCEIPFGKMHSRNPEIIRYAKLIGRTPSALAMKLTNFASLDPAIRSTGRKGLTKASQADRDIWNEMTSNWNSLTSEIYHAEHRLAEVNPIQEVADELADTDTDYTGVTESTLIEARVGQSFFRQAVLSAYDFRCCITGLAIPELLVASHIVPWRTDSSNRLNPRNGLCLSVIHDRAFDIGLIAISEDFRLLVSKRLREPKPNSYIKHSFQNYADRVINLPDKFIPDMTFLKYHREHLYRG
jgi:predicted restriction endonuclease